jgi:hypothetical protein
MAAASFRKPDTTFIVSLDVGSSGMLLMFAA